MFTGIIEEIGKVIQFTKKTQNAILTVQCKEILNDIKIGDSISVNGVCQTIVKFSDESFTVEISNETLNSTNFEELKIGQKLNLERALTPNSRMGGHIVQGHVDKTAQLIKITQNNDFCDLYFKISDTRLIVSKGSIAINGVSLTVANVDDNEFKIAIIPHTLENTNLKYLQIGDIVNVETDILGRYVEKFLSPHNNKSNLTVEFLAENGFI